MKKDLKILLADSYLLLLKTHNFHWNVNGPLFVSLHSLYEEQYNNLFLAVDEIAERIKSIGNRAPGSYKEFSKLSKISENTKDIKAKDMILDSIKSHKIIVKSAKKLIESASKSKDDVTVDLAIRRKEFHEKSIWMLKSLIE